MQKTTLSVLIVSALTYTGFAQAESFRQHGSHVHGQVEINVAQDGSDLLVEILAPGADVVGFEHTPTNHEQQHAIHEAVETLNVAANVFAVNAEAECTLTVAEVTHTLGGDDHHDEHADHDDHEGHDHHDEHADHDDHEDHDHSDEHADHDDHEGHDHSDEHADHDDHEGHDHSDEHDDHDHSGGHGEFNVQYQYSCAHPEKLNAIETGWFEQFASSESVTLNLLTDSVQTSSKLTAGAASYRF
jgi:hypothetical protein